MALVDHRSPWSRCPAASRLDTVAAYAAAGVDLISIGAITHSAPVLDIGLDLDRC